MMKVEIVHPDLRRAVRDSQKRLPEGFSHALVAATNLR